MTETSANRIERQIIYGKLAALNMHAGERLQRISRSPLIAENRMFAAAVLTPGLELAHQIQFEPEHLYALRASVRHAFDVFAYDIAEGDVIVTADPYGGGTKGQALTMAVPVFVDGELTMFPAIRAQLADLGGEIPGGYNPVAFELWQESVRITPVKLFAGGKLQRDVFRFLTSNSRTPDWLGADLEAMHSCCREAQRSLLELIKQYGDGKVRQSVASMIAYTNAEALRALPGKGASHEGRAEWTFEEAQGTVRVHGKREGGRFVFDFAGSSGQGDNPFNCTAETAKACAVAAALADRLDELPLNDGLLEAFRFEMPAGSVVAPEFPAATALGGSVTGHAVAAAVTDALGGGGKRAQDRGGNADTAYPAVHGNGPWAMLYAPIGSPKVVPLRVDPGFPSSPGGWGPSGLYGSGRLASAEEMETGYGFRLERRERTDDRGGGMDVRLRILEGEWEFKVFSPDKSALTVRAATESDGSRPQVLKSGDLLEFRYAGPNTSGKNGGEADGA